MAKTLKANKKETKGKHLNSDSLPILAALAGRPMPHTTIAKGIKAIAPKRVFEITEKKIIEQSTVSEEEALRYVGGWNRHGRRRSDTSEMILKNIRKKAWQTRKRS